MELLLHFTWKHRLCPQELKANTGERVEIIDPGLHNANAGPDFLNAKIKIGGTLWAGNVEIHERASDWYRHHHEADAAYNNTILHVVGKADRSVLTAAGESLPQVCIEVPRSVADHFHELMHEAKYPPCYRVIPHLPQLTQHAWLSALTTERLEEKTLRIDHYLEQTGGNWEQAFFIALARNFGFGVNAEAFEQWACTIRPTDVGKHRDDLFQVEAFFFGQAGLLADEAVAPERRDDYFLRLQKEYRFLQQKFSLQPLPSSSMRLLRMRPQNFPHVRLSQLARLYHEGRVDLSRILETPDCKGLRALLSTTATPYWQTHYTFGVASAASPKTLQAASLDLLLINTVAPLLFAYGRRRMDERLCERAFALLESLRAERNFITRSWAAAGIKAQHAADSQALIQLKNHYCDRKDCLRCRFGTAYLHPSRP